HRPSLLQLYFNALGRLLRQNQAQVRGLE
ncbi:MAG: hypothetical protein AVDCRST_MAG05-4973, partial [uncultured Rubrobacteraceae bacterium]